MSPRIIIFCTLITLAFGTGNAAPPDLPSYHFEVGQQLTFHEHNEFKYENGKFRAGTLIYDATTTIWIVSTVAPGRWRVLARILETESELDKNGKLLDPGSPEPTWVRANISANGETDQVESAENHSDFPDLIVLPKSTDELAQGWRSLDPIDQSTNIYSATPVTPSLLQIHQIESSTLDEIYLRKKSCEINFDRDKGLPVHQQLTMFQGYGLIGTTSGSVDLTAVSMADLAFINQLDHDFSKYLQVTADCDPLETLSSADVESGINKLQTEVKAERAEIHSTEFIRLFDQLIASLPTEMVPLKNLAQEREKLLAGPMSDWKTTDLEGKVCSLSDFKGSVVVLDFWYRGCGWCMRAMPQIEDVAQHYANRPVVVLGMCTNNPKSGDAQFVAKKMGLTYPILNAEEIAKSYHLQAFPTTIILDRSGEIKDLQVGWEPNLRDALIQKIDAILLANTETVRSQQSPSISK